MDNMIQAVAVNNSIGLALANEVVKISFTAGALGVTTDTPKTQTVSNKNILVTAIDVVVYKDGTKIHLESSTMDKLLLNIVGEMNVPFASQSMPINTLAKIGTSDNFKGLILKINEPITYTLSHVAQNWTSGTIDVYITFSGFASSQISVLEDFGKATNGNIVG